MTFLATSRGQKVTHVPQVNEPVLSQVGSRTSLVRGLEALLYSKYIYKQKEISRETTFDCS
jgi:hypothetical protein